MTNERAVEILNLDLDILGQYGGETAEAYKMAIKALEQQPTDAVSRQAVIILIDEASEMHPYKVIGDSDTYSNYNQGWSDACDWLYANIEGVPSVIPQIQPNSNEFFNFDAPMVKKSDAVSRSELQKTMDSLQVFSFVNNGHEEAEDYYNCESVDMVIRNLPSVTPKYTDEEIDKIQEIEQAYVDKMVELAVEETKRPKGKWIEIPVENDIVPVVFKCSECGMRVVNPYKYCPNCGAEMSGGEENV